MQVLKWCVVYVNDVVTWGWILINEILNRRGEEISLGVDVDRYDSAAKRRNNAIKNAKKRKEKL